MPADSTSWYGTFKINDGSQGWTETFNLLSATYAACIADMEAIWVIRKKLLPPTSYLQYGSVGQRAAPRDAQPLTISFPAPGTSGTLTPAASLFTNDVEFAVHYRLYTGDGKGVSYHLRAMPDDQVEDKNLVNGPVVIPTFPAVNAGTAWIDRLGDYLSIIKAKTQYAQRIPDLPGPPITPQFNHAAWSRLVYRGLRKKNTGRPFGLSLGRARPH